MRFLLVLLPAAATVVAAKQLEQPAEDPILGTATVHGCYSTIGELLLNGTDSFNSQGSCTRACTVAGASVAASQANRCYCGDKYPPASKLVDDSLCSEACPGYAVDACGGVDAFTVYNTGLKVTVEDSTASDSSSAKGSTTTISSSSSSATSASTPVTSGTSASTPTPTTSGSNGTSSSASSSARASGSTTSPGAVGTNGAISRIALGSLNMAFAFSLTNVLLM